MIVQFRHNDSEICLKIPEEQDVQSIPQDLLRSLLFGNSRRQCFFGTVRGSRGCRIACPWKGEMKKIVTNGMKRGAL